ncbi:MAG: polyprenyl synthetase family protein [Oscillospiraceae bacterium]|nr:polyprenyl synthetase family protein [Oscillospiraceae bacterium]
MQNWYKDYVTKIEAYLDGFFCSNVTWTELYEAMRYSLLSGGKRIRPVLALEFCRVSGGTPEQALPFAAAVEMIHTYSLIHDDLPAMDNDDLRRGRPTTHIKFGEGMAILAGDALQSAAFRAVLATDLPEDIRCRAGLTLARFAGEDGMVAGQVLDLAGEKRPLTAPELGQVHLLKTSALIQAACVMGTLAGGGTETQVIAADKFARALGVAFQIQDDILDCIGEQEKLGKPIGSDAASGKTTVVTLHGLERAQEMLKEQTEIAKAVLAETFDDTAGLLWLADWLLGREY